MRPVDRIWIATAIAGALGALLLLPLTSDASYLFPALLVIGVLSVAAVVGDRLRLEKGVVNGIQFLLTLALAASLAIGSGPADVAWFARLIPLLRSGYNHIQTNAAPMPPEPGAQLILTLITVVIFLITGIIADTLEKPAWTLATLLALYLIPALALRSDVNVFSFLCVAIGYLAILMADGLNSDRRWTRNLSHDSAQFRGSRGIWRLSAIVATPALIGAILLGITLPTMAPTLFTSLRPNGTGPIEMVDPQLDLRKNLEQGTSRQVLSYTTNKPTGTYLKLTTLPVLTAEGWSLSQVSLKQGTLGSVPGVSAAPSGGSRITKVQVDDFASMYLPVPYAPRAQSASGEWSYDPGSLTIIATDLNRNRATVGLSYTVESWDVEPGGEALSAATVGVPDGQPMTLDLPNGIPNEIVQLTTQLTASAEAPALKAAAIQAYLRSSAFSYSVQGSSGKTSYEAISTFLTKTKTGYCVQYASAMALMARIAGIPSRVAVGFLPGTQSGDHWLVTSHDMHAWPELYFAGQGWVRFEPTPSVAVPPSWSIVAQNQPSVSSSTVAEPSISNPVQPSAHATDEQQAPTTTATNTGKNSLIRTWIILGIVVAVLLVLLLTPLFIRRRIRRNRLEPGSDPHEYIAGLWFEIRDTWLDLGRRWPSGTPRQIGDVIGERLSEEVNENSLVGVVRAVEQSRYSNHFDGIDELKQQAEDVLYELEASRTWYRKLSSIILPASLLFSARQWWERISTRTPSKPPEAEPAPVSETAHAAFKRPLEATKREATKR